jgi:hypothetical protein
MLAIARRRRGPGCGSWRRRDGGHEPPRIIALGYREVAKVLLGGSVLVNVASYIHARSVRAGERPVGVPELAVTAGGQPLAGEDSPGGPGPVDGSDREVGT